VAFDRSRETELSSLPEPPLTADPRPDQRQWTRLPRIVDQHVTRSEQMILSAAEQTATARAIVLGPGRCTEIPVERLAKRFDHVDMVDMDKAALDEGLASLSLDDALTAKLNIQQRDLTGVIDMFEEGLTRIISDETDFDVALLKMTDLLQSIKPQYPVVKQQYDLVIASVVLSQLHVAVSNLALSNAAKKWPNHVQTMRKSQPWTQAMLQLATVVEPAFVRYVQDLLAPGGRIFLSATMHTCFIHEAPNGDWYTDGRYRMTTRDRLADYVDDRATSQVTDEWFWIALLPVAGETAGKLFSVEAAVLRAD